MSTVKFVQNGYEVDLTPEMLPNGKFVARAVITRQTDQRVDDIWPDFEPFTTEAEAVSAAHLAAVAWLAQRPPGG